MKQEYYEYYSDNQCLYFEFESVSKSKTVKKIIVFSPLENNQNLYNLALADANEDGSFSDKAVTNNDDMEKVIATVIQAILRFFEKYPSKWVYIEGSTPDRTRLYRIVISKELLEVKKIVDIYGILGAEIEEFIKNRAYDSFVLALNSEANLLKLLYENDRGH
jgi:hypothetical protein